MSFTRIPTGGQRSRVIVKGGGLQCLQDKAVIVVYAWQNTHGKILIFSVKIITMIYLPESIGGVSSIVNETFTGSLLNPPRLTARTCIT